VSAVIHLGFHAAATAAPTIDAVALVLAGWTTFGMWCLWLGRLPSRGFRQNEDDGSDGGGGGGGPDDEPADDGPPGATAASTGTSSSATSPPTSARAEPPGPSRPPTEPPRAVASGAMREAKIEETEHGRVPADEGWYILNLSEMRGRPSAGGGAWCGFGSPDEPSDRIGIGVHILWPGDSPGFYHEEGDLEGFLVLSGRVHRGRRGRGAAHGPVGLPALAGGTRHITVGAGDGPCAILMYGLALAGRDDPLPRRAGRGEVRALGASETDAPRRPTRTAADRPRAGALAARVAARLRARRAASARPASCGS
jgi:hypothetical protein